MFFKTMKEKNDKNGTRETNKRNLRSHTCSQKLANPESQIPIVCVLVVIILLKDNIIIGFVEKIDAFLKCFIWSLSARVSIHLHINIISISHPFLHHVASYHHRSSTELLGSIHQPITEAPSCPSLHSLTAI